MNTEATGLPVLSADQRTALLRSCAASVAETIATALPEAVTAALQTLSSGREPLAGQQEARQLLAGRRDELGHGFLAKLKQKQEGALARLLKHEQPGRTTLKISADSLSLIDDDEDSGAEIVSKAARRIRGTLEGSSGEIQVVLQYLTGREHIRPADDPFDPEVCLQSLREAAGGLGLQPAGVEALVGAFERPLGEGLARAHAALGQRFRSARLAAAEIRRELAYRAPAGKASTGSLASSTAAQRLAWADEAPRVGGLLPGGGQAQDGAAGAGGGNTRAPATGGGSAGSTTRGRVTAAPLASVEEMRASLDDFLARLSGDVQRGLSGHGFTAAVGEPPADLIDAVDQMQQMGARAAAQLVPSGAIPAGNTALAQVVEGSLVDEAWRDELLSRSSRTVDKLTIEIVGMVFEHVLDDSQVPAEIKASLSRLQFPVLKVALTDADFFASSAHPARRLIDRVASTSVGWEPYGDENLRYKVEVDRIVQQVLERFDKDVSTFEQLLGEFDAFIAELPVRESDPIARAKSALEEAERREVLVINTTIQVRRAFEHVELEPYLREFLVGPWVQVLVSATLRDEQTPGFSKAFRQAIHDVVWSVQPKVSAEERKRLVSLIPEMTRVLRDGLSMIRMPDAEQQSFLRQLMASHAVAVRPVDQATYIKAKVATGDLRQKLDEMKISDSAPMGVAAGGMKVSMMAVRRAAESRAAELVIAEPPAGATPLSFEQEAEFDAAMAGWQRGDWFNLYDGRQTLKVKLRWISPLRTLFMFGGGEDKSARVLSLETVKSYLNQGWLKRLESEPLMKRAVDRVVGEFQRGPDRAQRLVERLNVTAMPKPSELGSTATRSPLG